jgi:hypothetical protein
MGENPQQRLDADTKQRLDDRTKFEVREEPVDPHIGAHLTFAPDMTFYMFDRTYRTYADAHRAEPKLRKAMADYIRLIADHIEAG